MTPEHMFTMEPEDTIPMLREYYFPPYITLINRYAQTPDKNWAVRKRTLKQYLLEFVLDGVADIILTQETFRVGKGDLFLIRPNETHTNQGVPANGYSCISVVFHFGQSGFPLDQVFTPASYLGSYGNHPIENLLHQLLHHYRKPDSYHQTICQHTLMSVLIQASEALGLRKTSSARSKAQLEHVRRYIVEHYRENLALDDLEAISELSRNYLIQQFKQAFGLTPKQYLNWVRVQNAKELAVTTSLTIGEIAERVGYADVHTFGRMFKKQTGTSLSMFCSTLVHHS